jgi:hypothetical protein
MRTAVTRELPDTGWRMNLDWDYPDHRANIHIWVPFTIERSEVVPYIDS